MLLKFFKDLLAQTAADDAQPTVAISRVSGRPLVINPDASDEIKHMLYRKDAIERYTHQMALEMREIADKKMKELTDEYSIICIKLRAAGVIE